MKNPLVDVAAILICLLAVVIGRQYFINQKSENSLKSVEKKVELRVDKKPTTFESAVKITE